MSIAMENEVKKYEKYKRDVKFLLVTSGVWPNFQPHPRSFRIFLSICSAFASASTFFGIIAFCKHHGFTIQALTKGLGLLIGFFSTFIKVWILASYEKDLISLNEGLTAAFENDLKVPELRKHLLFHFRKFSGFFYVYSYLVGLSVVLLIIMPLTALKHGKYVRMFPQILPFSYEPGGAVHWSIYGFEIYCGYYLWSVSSGSDSVFGLYALHMVGELRVLSQRFQSLKSSPSYREDMKECVKKHLLLMKSRHTLQRVFGFLAIWLAITCAVALCALVFQATEIKNMSILRICYLMGHCFLKVVQAYSYGWYGNIINVESELCLMSIYNAMWPGSGDLRFMSDVLIVMSQKPLIFKAKGCMYLGLDMFSKIIHTSVSYFFLLKTLEEKS